MKSSGILESFGVLPQKCCHKNCRTIFTTHFSPKEEKYGKKSLDEQVQPKYNISEDGNQWEHLLMHLSVEHLLMHFSEEIIILDNYNN